MPDSAEPLRYCFEDFLLDKAAGVLLRHGADGGVSRIQLGSRAFQLLSLLVERRGAVVTRQEIMDAVWPNLVVEENNLSVQLSSLRRALDVGRHDGSCIRTLPGRGYQLLSPVSVVGRWQPDGSTASPFSDDPTLPPISAPDAGAAPLPPMDRRDGCRTPPSLSRLNPLGERLRPHLWRIVAMCLCVVAVLAAGLTWITVRGLAPTAALVTASEPPSVRSSSAGPSSPVSAEAGPISDESSRWAIAVLPFIRAGEGVDEQTVNGITDGVAIDMSQFPGLRVIARQATLIYKDRPIDTGRIGRELSVRYVVDGSVRRQEALLRINAQLLSTETGEQIWAERFDIGRPDDNRTAEDIARQIAFLAAFRATDAESARSLRERRDNPSPADILARARSVYNLPPGPERETRMLALYQQAVDASPASAAALSGLAEALLDRLPVWNMWNEDPRVPSALHRADQLVTHAEQLDPTNRMVMLARLVLLGRQGRCPEIVAAARRTMELHPTLSSPHLFLGICLLRDGKPVEAIAKFDDSIRVNPRNPSVDSRYRLIGFALIFLARYDEAVASLLKGLSFNRSISLLTRGNDLAAIAAAQALAGNLMAARQRAAEAVRLWPTITARSYFPFPMTSPDSVASVARMRDGLRLAGIRDHADEDADPGLPADDVLRDTYAAPTPIGAPGVRTIRTTELVTLLEQRKPLVLDMHPDGITIPGAIGLWGAGISGSLMDDYQDRLARKMAHLTSGDSTRPLVTVGWNSERYAGRNLALRLAALGYTEVFWYRGGREAWLSAGLPAAEVTPQAW